jgi:hypothetical protein
MFFNDTDFEAVDNEIEQALLARSLADKPPVPKSTMTANPVKAVIAPSEKLPASTPAESPSVDFTLAPVSTNDALLFPRSRRNGRSRITGSIPVLFLAISVSGLLAGFSGSAAAQWMTPIIVYAAALLLTAIPSVDATAFRHGAASLVLMSVIALFPTLPMVIAGGVVILIEAAFEFLGRKRGLAP